jgi:hypothetical protein
MPDPILHRRDFLGLLACSPFLTAMPRTQTPERVGSIPMTYSFTLILSGIEEATEEAAEAIYGVCDDCLFGSSGGVVYVDFDREADSLLDALKSAIRDVRKAGLKVDHVKIEVEDL